MPKSRWANLPEGARLSDLQVCTGCACVIFTGQINVRASEEEPYILTGQQIHDTACTSNLGLGPRIPAPSAT